MLIIIFRSFSQNQWLKKLLSLFIKMSRLQFSFTVWKPFDWKQLLNYKWYNNRILNSCALISSWPWQVMLFLNLLIIVISRRDQPVLLNLLSQPILNVQELGILLSIRPWLHFMYVLALVYTVIFLYNHLSLIQFLFWQSKKSSHAAVHYHTFCLFMMLSRSIFKGSN